MRNGNEEQKDYKKKIFDLLSNYVDGKNLFRDPDGWDIPLQIKSPEAFEVAGGKTLVLEKIVLGDNSFVGINSVYLMDKDGVQTPASDGDYALKGDKKTLLSVRDGKFVPSEGKPLPEGTPLPPKGIDPGEKFPTSWLMLQTRVFGILAHEKYNLKTYPIRIQIISAEQMMDLYSSVGMPFNYRHWSFGKSYKGTEDAYKAGQMGLAYEIVINSNPSIAYCMEENSPTMQMLVTAHAAYGHNSFFKENYMFKENTDADEIIPFLAETEKVFAEYERVYGEDAVEEILDSCHALQDHAVTHAYARQVRRTPEEERERHRQREEANQQNRDYFMERALGKDVANDFDDAAQSRPLMDEENLLKFIAENAPNMERWQRDVALRISRIAQYFWPQKQTQVMNEGWASFWHYNLVKDMHEELELISDKQWGEFVLSHTGVIFQPDYDNRYYSGFNPYKLGFEMYNDIRRICENPTDEDRRWFPDIAGSDWRETLEEAMANHKDETFILQYLSPKLIRDFKLFAVTDDDEDSEYTISAIHDDAGYRDVRAKLAANYNIAERMPQIRVVHHNARGDHSVFMHHLQHNRRPMDEKTTEMVLSHFHALWTAGSSHISNGYRIILDSVDAENREEIVDTFAYPPMPPSERKHGFNLMGP